MLTIGCYFVFCILCVLYFLRVHHVIFKRGLQQQGDFCPHFSVDRVLMKVCRNYNHLTSRWLKLCSILFDSPLVWKFVTWRQWSSKTHVYSQTRNFCTTQNVFHFHTDIFYWKMSTSQNWIWPWSMSLSRGVSSENSWLVILCVSDFWVL